MELIGIENEAEFFPSGTLSDVLKEELADITARWAGLEKKKHPVERLQGVSGTTLDAYRQIRASSEASKRLGLTQETRFKVLEALGYEWKREAMPAGLDGQTLIPLLGRVSNADGKDALWIIEAPVPSNEDEASDPLDAKFSKDQFAEEDRDAALLDQTIGEFLAKGVFELPDGPRNVLIVGLSQLVLVDKRKWPARSVLRFNLQEIFARSERDTLVLVACLIAREARVPEQGVPISDRLEEEAQRNANAVTSSLKKTVRDAIELLGQEVLEVTEGKFPSNYPIKSKRGVWIEGPDLSRECLRYMYRLLFMFYAEANPRLSLLDLKNPIYNSGYSLEGLRDLESVPLRTTADRAGTFLWESLQTTLNLLYTGLDLVDDAKGTGLRLPAVKVSLLDPRSTPLLNSLSLRNEAMQKVIRLLSLRSTNKSTGRISYAKLGIGQLGAVYETLISFTGVVAKNDLIELLPSKGKKSDADPDAPVNRVDEVDPLAPSWFVERRRLLNGEFTSEEVVFKGSEALVYPKGTFIYRLAGRDREKSASYYTPEPLARLLVKHALTERCKHLSADELLELKILEPAMGSAAFLVETTNQLADLYLDRKQQELGKTIPQDQIVVEKQKVRSFIADRNCFGVDLNPIAVELGAISLWLNGLHNSTFSPWFGDQLHAGNSLLGARRASYDPKLTTASRAADLWLNAKPQEIGWRSKLPVGQIWQWLLPAKDMAKFDGDKTIKPFAEDEQKRIKDWRQGGFFKKLEKHEVQLVQKLSKVAEALFEQVADDLEKTRISSNDEITIWPDHEMAGNKRMDFHAKAKLTAHLVGDDHATNTLPYKRLKTAMDAWCALWLWPLDQADKLPSRLEFLNGMAMILEGGFSADGSLEAPSMSEFSDPELDFFDQLEPDAPARDLFKAADKTQDLLFRETNVEALIETFDWLGVATEVAERERFVHFDLIFADVMRARGGFDVIVGNPPWAKPSWNEGLVLADIDPYHRGLSATEARDVLGEALEKARGVARFSQEYVSTRGAMAITASEVMQPFAGGGSNNLYRCFVDLSFRLTAPQGYAALIHQDGHLGDPNSGEFRSHWYARTVSHFEFINRMKSRNFAEVDHNVRFSLNIYRGEPTFDGFDKFTYAFAASQVEDSYADQDGLGDLPGIKNDEGNWDTRGHRDRIMRIDRDALSVIHALSEEADVPVEQARFIQPFSARTLDVFKQMAKFPKLDAAIPKKLMPGGEEVPLWQMSAHWHETGAQKDGTIKRATEFRTAEASVLQGPLFHVGNPLYKTPRAVSRTNADYDVIDLTSAPDDYLPRTNYGPAVEMSEYRRRMTRCRWDSTKSHTDFYRVAFRNMIALNGERSLISALIPPQIAHIHKVESIVCESEKTTLSIQSISSSIPFDFLLKASGRGDLFASDIARWPFPDLGDSCLHRTLRLNCLTSAYADLWNRNAPDLQPMPWSTDDPRLTLASSAEGPSNWDRRAGLRTEFTRRMALVEIDVLVAQALGLTLDQLIEIYGIYFPILQENEAGTWYDQEGRIVWTCSRGLPGVGHLTKNNKGVMTKLGEAEWLSILSSDPDELISNAIDDTQPGGPREITRRFVGPFTRCDRIEDYKRAWAHFEALKAQGGS
ncbi:class I SAM-dependent DNA methyltransferase [Ruegeria sp. HU-ET01832]|uniref:Eco57I restriction-modification methylase domain-containing protein n=1 Tax=Ruegeria sp. HU-ET01832 TaxID=3135906 RepID=UPI00310A84F5